MARRKRPFNVYRDGKVHVCKRMCNTCIYREGSPLMNAPIKKEAVQNQTAVICHSTLDRKHQLVCRGFYENDMTVPLAVARATGKIVFQEVNDDKTKATKTKATKSV